MKSFTLSGLIFLFVIILALNVSASGVNETNLTSYWTLDYGSTSWVDIYTGLSNWSKSGTINTVIGAYNNGTSFGANSYFTMPAGTPTTRLRDTNQGTWRFFLNLTGSQDALDTLFNRHTSPQNIMWFETAGLFMKIQNESGAGMGVNMSSCVLRWCELVVTYNVSTARVFIDGVLMNTSNFSFVNTGFSTLEIGSNGGATTRVLNGAVDEVSYYGRMMTDAQVLALNGTFYLLNTSQPASTPTISFITPPTPTIGSIYYLKNESLTINATITNGNFNISLNIFNSTGTNIYSINSSEVNSLQTTINTSLLNLSMGIYYFNTTFNNATYNNFSETRNFILYNLLQANFINPINNQNINRSIIINWNNASTTNNVIGLRNYSLQIYNSSGNFLYNLSNTNSSFFNWNTYQYNLSLGNYTLRLISTDNNYNTNYSEVNINITRNILINVTAISSSGSLIQNFTLTSFNLESGLNITSTTNYSYLEIDQIRGNTTLNIDAPGFGLGNLSTTNFFTSTANYSYRFFLFETNVFNISFYKENAPTTLINGVTITLNLISDLFASSYSTTNGTLYIPLVIPETYTLRYSAQDYPERFYQFTLTNRSFNNLNLYMINGSNSYNYTVYVVNEVLNPIEGAIVKTYKYNLASNTYILQEILTTDAQGKVVATTTYNNEYWRFLVEYDGVIKAFTDPDYIDSGSLTIPITLSDSITTDYREYSGITYSLLFNNLTNNFRFEWNDPSLTASQYCLKVTYFANLSEYAYNNSCSTGSSGVILLGINNVSGRVYYGKATYYQNGLQYFLSGIYQEFAQSTSEVSPVGNKYGLFLQILLTLGVISFVILNIVIVFILAPFSLILGKLIGLNIISWFALITLQVVGLILAYMMSVRR